MTLFKINTKNFVILFIDRNLQLNWHQTNVPPVEGNFIMEWKCIVHSNVVFLHQQPGENFMERRVSDNKKQEPKRYIVYDDSPDCKYCGNRLATKNGYCSNRCFEKDSVWNRT